MKIGLIGDVHWCQYSSIIRKRGNKYSLRLENCIKSVNWAEELTSKLGCEFNIYLGDFFDKPDLNSEEISALKEIKWNDSDKYFLVGNHEMGSNNLEINSSNIFELLDNYLHATETIKPLHVIDKPFSLADSYTKILLLPYTTENKKQEVLDLFDVLQLPYNKIHHNKSILLTHNDIAGIQLGNFESKQGFSIEEIENNFDLCIDGHLHNGCKVSDKIITIGNLTGQNFSENAHKYDHVIFILDTNTLKIDVYENPYAFNFYKEDWTEGIPFNDDFKTNSVLTVQTTEDTYEEAKQFVENSNNIIESRILLKPILKEENFDLYEDLSIDHYKAFEEYVFQNISADDIAKEEIKNILEQ